MVNIVPPGSRTDLAQNEEGNGDGNQCLGWIAQGHLAFRAALTDDHQNDPGGERDAKCQPGDSQWPHGMPRFQGFRVTPTQ